MDLKRFKLYKQLGCSFKFSYKEEATRLVGLENREHQHKCEND